MIRRPAERSSKVSSDELAFDHPADGKVCCKYQELPYGEQSVIMYDDLILTG